MDGVVEQQSLLVGEIVKYSVAKDHNSIGKVLDKVNKKEKPTDEITVTGYMIEDKFTKQIINVSYWRILQVMTKQQVIEFIPQGNIPGGYVRE